MKCLCQSFQEHQQSVNNVLFSIILQEKHVYDIVGGILMFYTHAHQRGRERERENMHLCVLYPKFQFFTVALFLTTFAITNAHLRCLS